jgi:hypothetical protein
MRTCDAFNANRGAPEPTDFKEEADVTLIVLCLTNKYK